MVKKSIWAALGLAGACVACCTVPLGLTLVGGLSVAGVAGWLLDDGPGLATGATVAALVVGVSAALWRTRRARTEPTDCAAAAAPACAAGPAGPAGMCGCAGATGASTLQQRRPNLR